MPYALRSKVDAELSRLEESRIIESVKFSEWAAPIVPVLKSDGTVRICGDYKVTVNTVAKPDVYKLPCTEDLFNKVAGGKTFTKLDLTHAYQQLKLIEESKDLTTINNSKRAVQIHSLTLWHFCSCSHFPVHDGLFAARHSSGSSFPG